MKNVNDFQLKTKNNSPNKAGLFEGIFFWGESI